MIEPVRELMNELSQMDPESFVAVSMNEAAFDIASLECALYPVNMTILRLSPVER